MKNVQLRLGLASLFFLGLLLFQGGSTYAQSAFNGYALYNDGNQNTAYLIDKDGNIAHSWSCNRPANYAIALKPNGNIVRGAVASGNQINGAAIGGLLQEYDPSGNVVWEFTYSTGTVISHHDIGLMPNGNVLLIAWERIANSDLQAWGYIGNDNKYATHFIEVQQNGSGGQIVWEWHIVDHFIQDTDPNKPNFGVISDHPERVNINVPTGSLGGGGGGPSDWFHFNGLDYNEDLDQIVASSRFLSEVFIIDHSTTTAEAETSVGGNAGMGGDFLYRWGNPSNYGQVFGIQNIPGPVHDARWIPNDGRPNAGYVQVFNNLGNSGSSTVDALELPRVGFNYTYPTGSSSGYSPSTPSWRHNCLSNASGQSASDRMSNGNTFVALSNGYMYEVDTLNNVVWQYAAGPLKAFRYECDHPGITALLGSNPCGLVGIEDESLSQIKVYPNPSTGIFRLEGLPSTYLNLEVAVYDLYGNLVLKQAQTDALDLSGQANGMYLVTITVDGQASTSRKVSLIH